MTTGWSVAALLRQYHTTGPEKGDGYDPSTFEGVDPRELTEARSLLVRRGLGGDTIDPAGLAHVGNAAVIAALPWASAWLATQGLPPHRADGFAAHLPLVRRVLAA